MKIWGTLFALGLCLLTPRLVTPIAAGPSPEIKLLLHLAPAEKGKKVTCVSHGLEGYEQVNTTGDLYPQAYTAYVLIADFDTTQGVTGVQFGLAYNDTLGKGVDIISWNDCALYQWPMQDWPAAYSGNLLTWNQNLDCQKTDPLVVGFFYLTAYSPDQIKLIPRPVDGLAQVAACGVKAMNTKERTDNVKAENLGWAGFGGAEGYNPWNPDENIEGMKKRFTPIKD